MRDAAVRGGCQLGLSRLRWPGGLQILAAARALAATSRSAQRRAQTRRTEQLFGAWPFLPVTPSFAMDATTLFHPEPVDLKPAVTLRLFLLSHR